MYLLLGIVVEEDNNSNLVIFGSSLLKYKILQILDEAESSFLLSDAAAAFSGHK